MKRSIIVCCALAFCGAGIVSASVPQKLPGKVEATGGAAAKSNGLAGAGNAATALGAAQDRAVANYKRNMVREAAAAKRERAKIAAAAAAMKKQAKVAAANTKTATKHDDEAKALANAQDRSVVSYKRNESRSVAQAKREQERIAAAAARAAKLAKKEAQALARAQDRVVAYYKRSLGIGSETVAKVAKGIEKLACFTGVQDRHARIGVQLVNGKVDYFAFYSKRKPRTCSIDVERSGHDGRWEDNGTTSKVTLSENKGVLLIHRKGGAYRFVFRNVDRMRFCGMDGKINGSLTVARGKSKCVVQGVMDGHEG
ncbi:MAG: hypothetical protein AMJ67_01120 [Betaproteobacteria bacterium SG8_41]|jgi:hypothetical protein|nr:MAG: hypothetical protein AMJ67_01120 [Betaproteobacteria bacterium SG8_41]